MPHTIEENLQRLVDARDDIAEVIDELGGTVSSGDGFEEFVTDIPTILTPINTVLETDNGKLEQALGSNAAPSLIPKTITTNGDYDPADDNALGYSSLTVEVYGSGEVDNYAVRLYDIDGTLVNHYSASNFLKLTELPSVPSHTDIGLTSQGWNWTLTDAKAYVTKYGYLVIGATYITTSGDTEIDIVLGKSNLAVNFKVFAYKDEVVTVDWGDDTATDSVTGTSASGITMNIAEHTYATPGEYTITVSGGSDILPRSLTTTTSLLGTISSNYNENRITAIRCGENVVNIPQYLTYKTTNLQYCTLPTNVVSISGNYAFYNTNLYAIILPNGLTSIAGTNSFRDNNVMIAVSFPKTCQTITTTYLMCNAKSIELVTFPEGITTIGDSAFYTATNLKHCILPDTVTSIGNSTFSTCKNLKEITVNAQITSIGSSAFSTCSSLESISIDGTLTTIGTYCFQECHALKSVQLPNTVETIGEKAFYDCYALETINVPTALTTLGPSAFASCYALKEFNIPLTVTAIPNSCFNCCYSLTSIILHDGITSIGTSAYAACSNVTTIRLPENSTITSLPSPCITDTKVHEIFFPDNYTSIGYGCYTHTAVNLVTFESSTPPTVGTKNAFNMAFGNFKIRIPRGSLSAYTSQQYYPTNEDFYEEYDLPSE